MTDRFAWVLDSACRLTAGIVSPLPLHVHALCVAHHVSLVPLSRMLKDGFTADQVFSFWGNRDGTASKYNDRAVIAYNDFMPRNRIRFTLCEELMHICLGHLDDKRFNLFTQDFCEELYAQYEHEAKTAAGMVLCPPKFFYTFEKDLCPTWISSVCGVSESCARRIISDYTEYREAIQQSEGYFLSRCPGYDQKQMQRFRRCRINMEAKRFEVQKLQAGDR